MMTFPQTLRFVEDMKSVKAQRDPKSYMGLERMYLSWSMLMAVVVMASISVARRNGVAARVLSFVWLPFAAAGLGIKALGCHA
jgi:hypothetical protein